MKHKLIFLVLLIFYGCGNLNDAKVKELIAEKRKNGELRNNSSSYYIQISQSQTIIHKDKTIEFKCSDFSDKTTNAIILRKFSNWMLSKKLIAKISELREDEFLGSPRIEFEGYFTKNGINFISENRDYIQMMSYGKPDEFLLIILLTDEEVNVLDLTIIEKNATAKYSISHKFNKQDYTLFLLESDLFKGIQLKSSDTETMVFIKTDNKGWIIKDSY